MQQELTLVSLYPRDMNIYGDRGNVLALRYRAAQHQLHLRVVPVNIGDPLPDSVDIVLGGGGQDSGQLRVADDLQNKAAQLQQLAARGVPMLAICGLYQLFGHRFITNVGAEITGVGLLDVSTSGATERLIGNVLVSSNDFGEIIGFENHSGHTVLGAGSSPLGRVLQGAGNNPHDGFEGARTQNVLGSYLHGALLPKNPRITDFLLGTAMRNRYGEFTPKAQDSVALREARRSAKQRPR